MIKCRIKWSSICSVIHQFTKQKTSLHYVNIKAWMLKSVESVEKLKKKKMIRVMLSPNKLVTNVAMTTNETWTLIYNIGKFFRVRKKILCQNSFRIFKMLDYQNFSEIHSQLIYFLLYRSTVHKYKPNIGML